MFFKGLIKLLLDRKIPIFLTWSNYLLMHSLNHPLKLTQLLVNVWFSFYDMFKQFHPYFKHAWMLWQMTSVKHWQMQWIQWYHLSKSHHYTNVYKYTTFIDIFLLFLSRFYSLMISLFSSHSWLFLWSTRTRTERQTQVDDVLHFSFVYYDFLFWKTKAPTDVEELRERTKQRNEMNINLRER